jgi:hypothetical protein
METIIPMIALGGLAYSMGGDADKTKTKQKSLAKPINRSEGYTNMNRSNGVPGSVPDSYPVPQQQQRGADLQQRKSDPYATHAHTSSNTAAANYFDQNNYYQEGIRGTPTSNTVRQTHSLTGNYVDNSNFKHNNMTPFYGGRTTQQTMEGQYSESMLDNMTGGGSAAINKVEQAPLFKPEDNVQWASGQPSVTDFMQSRTTPGMTRNNVKPFESEMVAPALNGGYNTSGQGGFNSGMEARDKYMPKTVNELRAATNPKMEYSLAGHQGPANSIIKNTGIMGKMEQHKPDTYFVQTQDRWLKTTGEEKAPTARSQQEVHDTARMTSQSYSGIAAPAGERTAAYLPGNYEASTRTQLPGQPLTNLTGPNRGTDTTGVKKSYNNVNTNRSIGDDAGTARTFGSGLSTAIGAVISPLTDIFRPTKKQEVIDNVRIYGDAGSGVERAPMVDPNDTLPTTTKETTLFSPDTYIQNQSGDAYLVTQHQPVPNQRDTTNQNAMNGVGGAGTKHGAQNYGAAYNQTNNESKEKSIVGRTNHGNTQMFNASMNVSVAKNDHDRDNNRMWAPSNMPSQSMSKEMYGKFTEPQGYQQNVAVERMAPDLLTAFKSNPYTHSLTSAGNM